MRLILWKIIHWGGGQGEWGNGSNFFLEVDLILELNLVQSTEQC